MTEFSRAIFGSLSPSAVPPLPMWRWQGGSGAWYLHTILPLSSTTWVMPANYIMVQRLPDGQRKALYVGQSENLHERLPRHEKLQAARLLGATELHVHLLATSDAQRFRIETDLRNGHDAALNRQSTPLYNNLLAALSVAPRRG